MKLLVAILAVLALVGSAVAWELTDDLQYTYVKTGYQQAGDNLITDAMIGAQSDAHFWNPCVTVPLTTNGPWYSTPSANTEVIPQSAAEVTNKLGAAIVDRSIYFPSVDMNNADFSAQLTQGGSAQVALHSQINDQAAATKYALTGVVDTPEMQGTASAYQNLNLAGGFDDASAKFDSAASVGVDSIFARTFIAANGYDSNGATSGGYILPENCASVSSEAHGGGMIESANLGAQVTADIVKSFPGSGWATPEYSGGLKMWADFEACDPGCTNPIVSTVSGSAWTAIFPGIPTSSSYGANDGGYWGSNGGYQNNIAKLTPFHI
jgi:hypothetical protein